MENGLLHAETKNIAFKKKSFTPSQYNSGPAKRGNDGNEYSDFQTSKGNTAWWAVDLGTRGARVTGVRIVNRRDCGKSEHNYTTHSPYM
jgi:hypothetical protein